MANNDILDLRIVGKKSDYDEEKIRILSIHAFSIWENARFFDSLEDAISDCSVAAGTTRRRGKKRKEFLVFPEEFAKMTEQLCDSANSKIALIFGNERTGLTDEELEVCTIGVNIPSSEDFGSLNLSHAVQVICYTIFRQVSLTEENKFATGYTPIEIERLNKTVSIISENLKKIGFFKITGQEDMENFWKSILSRAMLSEGEAKYIEKMFVKASGLANKNKD
jgi:tRNA/rRNA methyltransferase